MHDWIAPPGTDPWAIPTLVEAVLPGVKIYHRGDLEVHGFVNTTELADGSLHVAVCLYEFECDDPACRKHITPNGQRVAFRQAALPTAAQRTAMKAAIGEHATYRLTNTRATALATLRALGFPDDSPLLRDS